MTAFDKSQVAFPCPTCHVTTARIALNVFEEPRFVGLINVWGLVCLFLAGLHRNPRHRKHFTVISETE